MSEPRPSLAFLVTWPDHLGGTERATFTLAGALTSHYDVEVIGVVRDRDEPFFAVPDGVTLRYLVDRRSRPALAEGAQHAVVPDPVALDGVPSQDLGGASEPSLTRLTDVALDAALAARPPDVLVTTSPALLALATRRAPSTVAIVHVEHRATPYRGTSARPIQQHGTQADALVLLTEDSRAWTSLLLGPTAPLLRAIPNMLPHPDAPRSSGDDLVVLAAGRYVPDKQYDHLVRAFCQVAEDHPAWRLRLHGDGSEERRLRALAQRLPAGERVEVLPAVDDLVGAFAGSALTAMTSKFEGFPIVLIEALAAGVPIVAYDVPTGPRAIVAPGVNGSLVPSGDVDALARELDRLMGDEGARLRLADGAFESRRAYLPETVTLAWRDLLDTVLADRTAVPSRHVRSALRATRTAPAPAVRSGDGLRPVDLRVDVLTAVVDALEASGATWFAQRPDGHGRAQLVVEAAARSAVLRTLSAAAAHRDLHATPTRGVVRSTVSVPLAHPLVADLLAADDELRITAGADASDTDHTGVRLQLWSADKQGRLVALEPDEPTSRVSPAAVGTRGVRILGHSLPTVTPYVLPGTDEPVLPVDVVYTWVDGSDPEWREAFDATVAAAGDLHPASAGAARFRDLGELRFSLRSLHTYAPWVRHVYVVTCGQVPAWLAMGAPGLTVVRHDEIMDGAALPTFNSHAIEANLHHIDGLSEHFVYMNDDVLLGREVDQERLVTAGGITRWFPLRSAIGYDGADAGSPELWANRNSRTLVEAALGRSPHLLVARTPHALRRSVLAEMEHRWPDDFARTTASRFRDREDVAPIALHHHYAEATGRALVSQIGYAHVMTSRRSHLRRYADILRQPPEVVALGDNEADVDPDEQRQRAAAFMETLLPQPSPWERRGDG